MEEELKRMVEIAEEGLVIQKELLKLAKETNVTIRQMNVALDKIPG